MPTWFCERDVFDRLVGVGIRGLTEYYLIINLWYACMHATHKDKP